MAVLSVAGSVVKERQSADGGVFVAISVEGERQRANCRVVVRKACSGDVIKRQRGITNGSVVRAGNIIKKRSAPSAVFRMRRLLYSAKAPTAVVVSAAVVIDERGSSNGRVLVAGGVEQQCGSANWPYWNPRC